MKFGYNLGKIDTVLELEKYDINVTVELLEYEADRKNNEAVLALANLYASNAKVINQKLAIDWYTRATCIGVRGNSNIVMMIKTNQFDWSPKYHCIWPKLGIEILRT